MPRRLLRHLLLFAAATLQILSQPAIPDTPAGHALKAWLDAFNSGDRARIKQYVKTMNPSESVDGMLGFHAQTGGFERLSIESSEPTQIRLRLKEKNSPTTALGSLSVKNADPPVVQNFGLRAVPPGVTPVNVTLDAALRQAVIEGVNAALVDSYVDLALASKMQASLLAHRKAGDYDAITDGDAFENRLTNDLCAISHDKHLRVDSNPFKMPPDSGPGPEAIARMRQQIRHRNCSFEKAEVLPQNIGYVKFNGFADAEACAPIVTAAMNFLANLDALIINLRENGGGDPAMVSFVGSYLFDHPTHLNDLYNRKENSTHQFWTLPFVPGERLVKQPVFVLTSSRTFSGAEEFAYDLKTQKRARIVGETTGGGAHPVSGHMVADYFMVSVPFAKAVNPITKTDWEGTGVEPDVKVPAAEALAAAQKLAGEELQKQHH